MSSWSWANLLVSAWWLQYILLYPPAVYIATNLCHKKAIAYSKLYFISTRNHTSIVRKSITWPCNKVKISNDHQHKVINLPKVWQYRFSINFSICITYHMVVVIQQIVIPRNPLVHCIRDFSLEGENQALHQGTLWFAASDCPRENLFKIITIAKGIFCQKEKHFPFQCFKR